MYDGRWTQSDGVGMRYADMWEPVLVPELLEEDEDYGDHCQVVVYLVTFNLYCSK